MIGFDLRPNLDTRRKLRPTGVCSPEVLATPEALHDPTAVLDRRAKSAGKKDALQGEVL